MSGSAAENIPSTFSNSSQWSATWTYRDGDWRGTCGGTWHHDWYDDTPDRTGTFTRTFEASNPPHWPLFNTRSPPAPGSPMMVWVMRDCEIFSTEKVYTGTETHPTWGLQHNADDTQEAEDHYSDFDAWWDPDTGLVHAWRWAQLHGGSSGQVTSTDAP